MPTQAWTPRRAAAATRRHIASTRERMQDRLARASFEWADEDDYLAQRFDEARRAIDEQLDELEKEVAEALEDREG